MILVVTGGSGSGKSAYAENRILEFGDPIRYYIATMQCFDEESRRRVERHRRLRAGKGFETIERQLGLRGLDLCACREADEDGKAMRAAAVLPASTEDRGKARRRSEERTGSVSVLLECMSNLAANEMFDPAGAGENALEEIELGIDRLIDQCDNLVVVTNEIFSDGITYDPETVRYQKLLGEIDRYLFERADEAVEVVCGIPVYFKQAAKEALIKSALP